VPPLRRPASTAAAAAALLLVAVLPVTPSAGTHDPATGTAPPVALGDTGLDPGTVAPPVLTLDGSTGAARPGALRSPRSYSSAVDLTGGLTRGAAAPAALRAVRFALGQVGKPYVWGAEGPDTYDCSGLVQAAYAAAGVGLPRVARAQHRATTPVPVTAMIPGDLLFFGPDPADAESIHHVGIYLGGGQMVHAPTAGDVVRVAPVWWAEFFGAARVVGAVPGPGGAVPFPVFTTVSGPSPGARPDSTGRPAAVTPPGRAPADGGVRAGHPGAGAPVRKPAGPAEPTCPGSGPEPDRPAAGPARSVTGAVTGVVNRAVTGLLGRAPVPRDAAKPSPTCAEPIATARPDSGVHRSSR
jgi:cell wall-associated NlpC family hydrolase